MNGIAYQGISLLENNYYLVLKTNGECIISSQSRKKQPMVSSSK